MLDGRAWQRWMDREDDWPRVAVAAYQCTSRRALARVFLFLGLWVGYLELRGVDDLQGHMAIAFHDK